ncbi:hypothetical protein KAV79_01820 [Candidatus Aerophobetes bacterium]|nr:hypothetical protein [Candidatus Aerophobetes bacterium]
MPKIALVADKHTSLPFLGVGINTVICEESKEVKKIFQELFEQDYGIIFITESLASKCLDVIEELSDKKPSLIITIVPDFGGGALGAAEQRLKNLIKKAVGMELPE